MRSPLHVRLSALRSSVAMDSHASEIPSIRISVRKGNGVAWIISVFEIFARRANYFPSV